MTGKITNIMSLGKDVVVTILAGACEFEGGEAVEVKKQTKKRSLSANAYFHLLSDKIADAIGVSKPYAKNFLLARYGQRELDDNGEPLRLAVKEGIDLMEREDIHATLVGYDYIDGEQYDIYEVIRGSHTYTSAEFNALVTGAVSEAKLLGIETMTPQEIERLDGIAKHYTKGQK